MIRLALIALVASVAPAGLHAQPACLSDADARTEVQAHKLVSVQHAISAVRAKSKGDLLSAHLCKRDNGFVYRISILGSDGHIDRLLINAANGHLSD